jgi:predicted dehydrogenase
VDVVSDLMIHDIDLVLDLVGSPVTRSARRAQQTLVNRTRRTTSPQRLDV